MRWRKLPLHLQIVFASSLVIIVTLMITTWWNVDQQRQQLLDDITQQASGLARTASLASRYMVIAEKLDELESMLLSLAFYPDLIQLVVMDKKANVLSDIHTSIHGPKVSYDNLHHEQPQAILNSPKLYMQRGEQELLIWQPIETSTLLGWVMVRIDLSRANNLEDGILLDNMLATGVVLIIDLCILLIIMYLPGKSFRQAVHFAQHLTENPGEKLQLKAGSYEVIKLIDALNVSSTRLKQQREELEKKQSELEDLNHHLEQRVNERTEKLAESREALLQLHQAVDQSSIAIIMLDSDFMITECNPAFHSMSGHEISKSCGVNLFTLIWSELNPAGVLENIQHHLNAFDTWRGEVLIRHANDNNIWVQMGFSTTKNDDDNEAYYLFTLDDISDRKDYEAQLIHQAKYDALTGLPNRVLGMDRLNQAIRQDHRLKMKTVALYLDLDRFKQVNDTLGHRSGDLLLIEMACRLSACVREYDTVCRLSGDEFMVVLSSIADTATIEAIAEKILQTISRPFIIEERELHMRASIGIAVIPDDGTDADEVLRYADTAMYQAKQFGRNCFKYYTCSMNEKAQEHMRIDNAMHTAIENNELELYLQPIVDTEKRSFIGAEALMRWNSSSLGAIAPDKFIAIAEENGLIVDMGLWILREACLKAIKWPEHSFVTVNVSSVQFRNREFITMLENVLQETGLAPERLHLEITENVVMEDVEEIVHAIEKIVALGIELVIDDFGTGYSSLSYLTRFPGSILKIDRSFVARMINDKNSAALVDAIIKMGHSLHMKIIAEGVETEQQLNILQTQGCDFIQGYYFSKPVPGDELISFILKNSPNL
ncbi:diguanylate cyclase/phosphodiesterase (GGDEF & EAL domains) with PAS/PAC sensor(s) [hydrothermal vent metagenome]|uniref:Diguanylate cyclase/phosphodiesterase (GGDEF & EAL domains) with PAS/PAC sensor(S) n=1 Tax=hydrothermal vent metagenome TaxID=652676 RepID=A0A3B0XIF3_9ZZZZ